MMRQRMHLYLDGLDASRRQWRCWDAQQADARLPLAVSKALGCDQRDPGVVEAWREVCADVARRDERLAVVRLDAQRTR